MIRREIEYSSKVHSYQTKIESENETLESVVGEVRSP